MPRALCLGTCLFSDILLSNSSHVGITELGLKSAKTLGTIWIPTQCTSAQKSFPGSELGQSWDCFFGRKGHSCIDIILAL